MSAREAVRFLVSVVAVCAVIAGCKSKPVQLVVSVLTAPVTQDLSFQQICTDSLGVLAGASTIKKCTPCLPVSMQGVPEAALRHARELEKQAGRVPYDTSAAHFKCIKYGYELSIDSGSTDYMLRVQLALFQLLATVSEERTEGLNLVDRTIDTLLMTGDTLYAAEMMGALGIGMWNRAQRLLARPLNFPVTPMELLVHDIGRNTSKLVRLPPIPRPSKQLGDSEADWARSLFEHAAQLVRTNEQLRSRFTRLALSTYVGREQWSALDSAARAVLVEFPHDSVAPLARALVYFREVTDPVAQYPSAMARFDSALRAMPRSDSARYDTFDDVLRSSDDVWRHEQSKTATLDLQTRSWTLVDPLWLTPVNEVHLMRRVRVAEADFRYAADATRGTPGSETSLGFMLLKRGVPEPRWTFDEGAKLIFSRGWPGDYRTSYELVSYPEYWRIMFTDEMTLSYRVLLLDSMSERCSPTGAEMSLLECSMRDNAYLDDVPFYQRQDTIDVTLARFRVSNLLTDLYIGSRLPLRRFAHNRDSRARAGDSIVLGVTVANALGEQRFHRSLSRALPPANQMSWLGEWKTRVPIEDMMHRVEAYEARQVTSARGSRMLTSPREAEFATTGFGMSDILVADELTEQRTPVRSWRDLRTVPNGGVVEPEGAVSLAWEIYHLTKGADNRSKWRVSISREDGLPVVTEDVRLIIIGAPEAGLQVHANEPNSSLLTYERGEFSQPVIVDYLRFNLPTIAPGRHVLLVRIDDLLSGKSTQRSVTIRVLDSRDQARR